MLSEGGNDRSSKSSTSIIESKQDSGTNEAKIQYLEDQQQKLKMMLDILLFSESFLTGLYSGISSVAMKFMIEVLREEHDMHAMWLGLGLSTAMTAVSLILNMTTMNHLLSLYPSLKAVPIS